MLPRLRLTARQLYSAGASTRNAMSTFVLPNTEPEVPINLPSNLSQEQLLSFPAFKNWIETLHQSLSTQKSQSHTFHSSPYRLRKIDIQSVDFFGGKRLGFVKLQAEVSNDNGEKLPGSVFLRGGSVGMMVRGHRLLEGEMTLKMINSLSCSRTICRKESKMKSKSS